MHITGTLLDRFVVARVHDNIDIDTNIAPANNTLFAFILYGTTATTAIDIFSHF